MNASNRDDTVTAMQAIIHIHTLSLFLQQLQIKSFSNFQLQKNRLDKYNITSIWHSASQTPLEKRQQLGLQNVEFHAQWAYDDEHVCTTA